MSEKEASPSTTSGPLLNLGGAVSPQELKAASGKSGSVVARWKAQNPTGAFDSAEVSFRYMPKAYNWFEVLWCVGLLYGVFIGIPVGSGVWAVWRIGSIVGWW